MAAGSLDLTDSFRESDRIIIVKDALAGKYWQVFGTGDLKQNTTAMVLPIMVTVKLIVFLALLHWIAGSSTVWYFIALNLAQVIDFPAGNFKGELQWPSSTKLPCTKYLKRHLGSPTSKQVR